MPELPEVETIRGQLAQKIIGKKLEGKEVVDVRRRAKLLIIDFDDGSALVFHLKLTGQVIFEAQPNKWTRRVFHFDDGSWLVFNDARKFGWWKKLKSTRQLEEKFGPEPLTLGFEEFKTILKKRPKAKIKTLLMDQGLIAGLGNIYSDEILFSAAVQPSRTVITLTNDEIKKIFEKMGKILNAAISHQGSSVEFYVNACGEQGSYVKYHKVYHKEKCPVCGTEIKKIKIGGRTAHFCPSCQK